MAKIGIRLADGKFYSILEDGQAAKKRLVVTTVKDDQPSVQIDVYRSSESSEDYVGSLIIENIPPRPSGEPDIRLDLTLDDDGNLNAFAREEATGEHQALTVSLKSLAEEEKYEIPDFDFQEDEAFDLSTDELPDENPFESTVIDEGESEAPFEAEGSEDSIPSFDDSEPAAEEPDRPRRASPLLIGILAALATALILAAAFFIYRCTADRQAEPPQAASALRRRLRCPPLRRRPKRPRSRRRLPLRLPRPPRQKKRAPGIRSSGATRSGTYRSPTTGPRGCI